jgi:hypothetical protein
MPMPLRQHPPMQQGYGPRMMPQMQQQRYYGGMPYGGFNHPPQMAKPMMTRNNGNGERNQGGGLLAKILGRSKQQGGVPGTLSSMNRAAPSGTGGAGGLLQSLTNPDALNGLLNNTQTVLKTAQQLGPVFQQYGPLVRNLPSLWKLYRGLKDASNENEENESTENDPILDDEIVEIKPSIEDRPVNPAGRKRKPDSSDEHKESYLLNNKRSTPKLYI